MSASEWFKLLAAAKVALHEMCHACAPRDSFTDAVDRLDAAITACEKAQAQSRAPADDEQRYRLTHELWMLYQLRYKAGAPQLDTARAMERERELAERLGLAP